MVLRRRHAKELLLPNSSSRCISVPSTASCYGNPVGLCNALDVCVCACACTGCNHEYAYSRAALRWPKPCCPARPGIVSQCQRSCDLCMYVCVCMCVCVCVSQCMYCMHSAPGGVCVDVVDLLFINAGVFESEFYACADTQAIGTWVSHVVCITSAGMRSRTRALTQTHTRTHTCTQTLALVFPSALPYCRAWQHSLLQYSKARQHSLLQGQGSAQGCAWSESWAPHFAYIASLLLNPERANRVLCTTWPSQRFNSPVWSYWPMPCPGIPSPAAAAAFADLSQVRSDL